MLWVIGIIGLVIVVYDFSEADFDTAIGYIITFIIGAGLIAGSIFGLIKVENHITISSYEDLVDTTSIVALQDNSKTSGYGGMVYVSVNTSGIYTYYYQLEDGGYKQDKVSADNTVIYEEENCKNPSVQEYNIYSKKNWDSKWIKILTFYSDEASYQYNRYEIHVPKGTIVQEFSLDAQT